MMATKTISSSLDPAIYRAAQRAAKEERRPQSSVVAEALRLYTGLPLETRQAILALEQTLGEERTASKEAIASQLPPADLSQKEIADLATEAVAWARRGPGA